MAAGLPPAQATQANILLGECKALNAPAVCWQAIIYAATWESSLTALTTANSLGYWGVLQGSTSNWPDPTDSKGMADAFLQGGKGFQGGGAISLANSGVSNPIEIAVRVEVPSIWPDNAYAKENGYPGDQAALSNAAAIVTAFGGGATPGGVAGLGGTGTVANAAATSQYLYAVGSTTNPDEDYWTAINRIAQALNWYLFSDGETVYLIDGADLINQSLGDNALIDVRTDRARIESLEFLWDNTAFQFTSTHKRKRRIQRQTKLTQVTSPTSARLNLFCGVDEFRAGDIMQLASSGPGDGRWVIGDCTRSVFQPYSQLTLVPPIMPVPESSAGSLGTPGAASGTASGAAGNPTGKSGNYASPFAKKYTATLGTNTDMGVDFGRQQGIATGDPIMAIGDCYCRNILQGWYAGQPTMFFELTDKSAGYWGWYVGEEIDPKVGVSGALIKGGTVVATYAASGTGIEIGWAASPTQTASQANGTAGSRHSGGGTPEGNNFLAFLQRVGAV